MCGHSDNAHLIEIARVHLSKKCQTTRQPDNFFSANKKKLQYLRVARTAQVTGRRVSVRAAGKT